jgi:hypothetical protein
MTPTAWKRLTLGAIIRRIGEDQEHIVLGTISGDVLTIAPGPQQQRVTDPEHWELVRTARAEARRYRQWLAQVQADDAEEHESPDPE